jgi:hypothetical protein
VQRLWERGMKLETGLQAIVRDWTEGVELVGGILLYSLALDLLDINP